MAGLFVLLGLTSHGPTALLVIGAVGFVDGTTEVVFGTVVQREADPRRYGAVFGLASAFMTTTMLCAVGIAPAANRLLSGQHVILAAGAFLVAAGLIAVARTRIVGLRGAELRPVRPAKLSA
jgi:uncharacterized membrane protein YraQ (UPF0718 family)